MRTDTTNRSALAITLLFAAATGACQGKPAGSAGTESAAADTGMSAAPAPAGDSAVRAAAGDSTGAPKAGLNDASILGMIDAANKADSIGGALAAKKGTDPEVKSYGEMMMKDHHDLRAAGDSLAKQLGVTPKPPAKDPIAGYANAEAAALQKAKKGEDFDKTYIDNEVSVHQAVIDALNMSRISAGAPELKEAIQKAIPVIQQHLEQAQTIQKRLSPTA